MRYCVGLPVITLILVAFASSAQVLDTQASEAQAGVPVGSEQRPLAQQESSPEAPPQGENAPQSNDARDRVFYPGDTEHFKPLARKLFANVVLDQKEIWTSPFRMRAKDMKWWIGFGALTAGLIATDRDSSTVLENSKHQVAWGNDVSKIGAAYTLIPLVAGFYGYGVLRDDAKAREVGVLGAEALLDSTIVVGVLKPIAGRNRPDSQGEKGPFFHGGGSFPSGHAITSWSLASVIAHEYGHGRSKLVPVLAYGLAGVVSTARFTAQKHYASDIVLGGAMGWFIGRYVYQTHMDHAIHRHAWQPRIVPEFQPAQRLYGVALIFGN